MHNHNTDYTLQDNHKPGLVCQNRYNYKLTYALTLSIYLYLQFSFFWYLCWEDTPELS